MARLDAPPPVRVTKENLVALPALAPYFAFGLIALALTPVLLWFGAPALEAGFYRHPRVLAALHGLALGWGTSIALGALQQMTAVVGATGLHSTRLAMVAFVPFGLGVVGLITGFYTLSPAAFAVAAGGIPLGAAVAVYNVLRTASTAQPTRRWLVIAPFVKGAAVYVLIAFVAGAALALNFTRGWLGVLWYEAYPFHIAMAVGGWFFLLVVGISYHLLTFFGLTDKGAAFAFATTVRRLIHGGIALSVAASVAARFGAPSSPTIGSATGWAGGLRVAALLAFALAGSLFVWEARGVYARPARQQATAVHHYIRLAHGYLAVVVLALLGWAATSGAELAGWPFGLFGPRGSLATTHYIALAVFVGGGWLTNTILGYLHRILAFFVWHNKYWGRGREPGVPAFRHMVNNRVASIGLVLYNGGVLGLALSLYTPLNPGWGLLFWVGGGLIAAANLVWTMLR